MLDQADFIARYDKHDTLAAAAGQLALLAKPVGLVGKVQGGIQNIVLAGMGGSASAGEFVRGWLGERLPVPLEVTRGYSVPGYVGPQSLVVGGSYSGTTEETLAALAQAESQGASVVVMASGGRMIELTREKGWAHFVLPKHDLPRFGVLSAVRAWAELLEAAGVLDGLVDELERSGEAVEAGEWASARPASENAAKRIAAELVGHPVVVYGGPVLAAVAGKWKIDLNESGKNLAFWNALPELSHNEFSGWQFPNRSGMKLVELQSELDPERVQRRFGLTNDLLSNKVAAIEVRAEGKTKLDQMLWTFMLGSYVAIYLGVLNQVDPATLPMVDELKKRLG